MEMASGLPLLVQQFRALFAKNVTLSRRNRRSTSLQLLSPLLFTSLMFLVNKFPRPPSPLTDPVALVSPPIPPCEHKYNIRRPCFDFVWSGNGSRAIASVVARMMENNPGRPIPSHKVKSFRTSDEVDEWLFNDPMRCPGAMHFVETNATVISYGMQTNSSKVKIRGHLEDLTFKFQIPLQIAAEREIVRSLTKDSSFSWVVGLKEFAHPAMESPSVFAEESPVSTIYLLGPPFFLAIAMFAFIFQMSSLVTEKELKLRQAMTMMGLYDTAYWLSWFTWEGLLSLLSSLLTVLFGMMFQFDLFLHNSFAVVFLVFFLFQLNMTAFAFMLSAFVTKSSSSTNVGFLMFIVGFLAQEFTELVLIVGLSRRVKNIWLLFPPNLFYKALSTLIEATSTPEAAGISWSERTKCARDDDDCFVTINGILIRLASTFFLWCVLAIYFDNIIPNSSGVRKSIIYFLRVGYWTNKDENKVEESICSCTSFGPPSEHARPDDEDVLEEENLVKNQAREGVVDPNVAVQIRGLVKTYRGKIKISCCSKPKKTSSFHAVKGLWVNFEKDQLFCLLGPNGAGKTTSVSCLTGIAPVTSGDALIYGSSIRSSIGMSRIRRMIGVCPQFDILWDALTGQEHLHLFASIKGLPTPSIEMVAQKSLAQVRLTEAAKMRAGSYSGGMKRRLSVAIALIGDPKLVILDEPTTGMDPISRRHVWDIIEDAKKGRAIILTTHSMEEADILSDRIGIMAKGRLRCIGTSIRLKSRFGTGFIANINFSGDINGSSSEVNSVTTRPREAVKQFFKYSLNVVPKEESKSFLTFVIPHDKEGLMTKFFAELEDRKTEFGIADIQLSLTTLEEVFLNIARQAELESAEAEGNLATLTLPSGVSVQVPVGARFIGIPETESADNPKGFMVEVFWEQDDSGNLCISGHSNDMPVPPNVQFNASNSTPTASNKNVFGQRGVVYAHVIDPSEIDASNFQRYDHWHKLHCSGGARKS